MVHTGGGFTRSWPSPGFFKGMTMSPEGDLKNKLRKLIGARILFSSLLLGSTLFLQFNRAGSLEASPLVVLYGLIACIFILSAGYALVLMRLRRYLAFAYLQTLVDTAIVTIILVVTGGFSSPFSFLYLVVIVTSSLLLPRRGTVLVAALCSVQFGLMVDFEYYGLLSLFDGLENPSADATGGD